MAGKTTSCIFLKCAPCFYVLYQTIINHKQGRNFVPKSGGTNFRFVSLGIRLSAQGMECGEGKGSVEGAVPRKFFITYSRKKRILVHSNVLILQCGLLCTGSCKVVRPILSVFLWQAAVHGALAADKLRPCLSPFSSPRSPPLPFSSFPLPRQIDEVFIRCILFTAMCTMGLYTLTVTYIWYVWKS